MELNTLIIEGKTIFPPLKHTNLEISSKKESWYMSISCLEEDKATNREMAQITICHHDKTWVGTIQDFFVMQAVAKNCLFELDVALLHPEGRDATRIQCKEEVENLLSHFK